MSVQSELIPANEPERLEALRRFDVLDTPRDGAFDRITRLASEMLEMPISIVSLVDHDRIWFKSTHGLDGVDEIERAPGLCASAILGDETWVIKDAKLDPRTLANPLVAGDFGLRFYAGSPSAHARRLQPRNALRDRQAAARVDREAGAGARRPRGARHGRARAAAGCPPAGAARDRAQRRRRPGARGREDAPAARRAQPAVASLDQALDSSKRILAELVEDAPNLRRGGD